jgi:phosphopantetheine adenylyltransferase
MTFYQFHPCVFILMVIAILIHPAKDDMLELQERVAFLKKNQQDY